MTASDVVYSLTRVKNIAGNPSFLMAGITATAPNATTVVLTSATPNTAIPAIVTNPALGIVDSKAVTADGGTDSAKAASADKAEAKLNAVSEGSGPYTLTSFNVTSQVTLTANPAYWGGAPHYGKIVIRNVEPSVQKLDVLRGESQIAVDLSPTQAQGMSGVQIVNGASPNLFFVLSNDATKVSKVTSNPDFQEAVTGRDQLPEPGPAGRQGLGAGGRGDPVDVPRLAAAGQAPVYNLAKAKAALAASGLGNPTVTMSYPSDLAVNGISFGDLAARVQQDLAQVGITVKLQGQSTQVALAGYRAGTEQMGLWYWGPDYPDPSDYLNFMPNELVGLRAGWVKGSDPSLEALAAKAAVTTQDSVRKTLYQQIQESMNTNGPFMPLIQPAQLVVGASSVKDLQSNAVWLVNLGELG